MINNVVDWPPKGKHSPPENDNARLCHRLNLAEAERSTWLAFRASRHTFFQARTLTAEIVMIEARDQWDNAFRQVERQVVAA